MKFYTGNVKNPDTIRCRSCPVDEGVTLDMRTMVEGEPQIHYGTCPRCNTRWEYNYGSMQKCKVQSHEFDVDVPSTWHLQNPDGCTHHDHEGRKTDEFYKHYFYFPFYLKQNIWNPTQPKCKRCGISIHQIITEVLPRIKGSTSVLQKRIDKTLEVLDADVYLEQRDDAIKILKGAGYQKAGEQFEADRKKAMETGEPVWGAAQNDPDA